MSVYEIKRADAMRVIAGKSGVAVWRRNPNMFWASGNVSRRFISCANGIRESDLSGCSVRDETLAVFNGTDIVAYRNGRSFAGISGAAHIGEIKIQAADGFATVID